jgi:hypothetical protein
MLSISILPTYSAPLAPAAEVSCRLLLKRGPVNCLRQHGSAQHTVEAIGHDDGPRGCPELPAGALSNHFLHSACQIAPLQLLVARHHPGMAQQFSGRPARLLVNHQHAADEVLGVAGDVFPLVLVEFVVALPLVNQSLDTIQHITSTQYGGAVHKTCPRQRKVGKGYVLKKKTDRFDDSKQLVLVVAVERRVARQQNVADHAHAPDVCLHAIWPLRNDLGGHIICSTRQHNSNG